MQVMARLIRDLAVRLSLVFTGSGVADYSFRQVDGLSPNATFLLGIKGFRMTRENPSHSRR